MKKQAFNPYLPLNEYVPDGEPYVFGDRVYVYGSHDEAGSEIYCAGHYMGWSAPVDDLSDWQCHGVIYKRAQDPSNPNDEFQLWAPLFRSAIPTAGPKSPLPSPSLSTERFPCTSAIPAMEVWTPKISFSNRQRRLQFKMQSALTILFVQSGRQIPMVQGDQRLDAGGNQLIAQVAVKFQALLVDLTDSVGQDTAPADGEAVALQADLFHQGYIFLVAMIVITGYVAVLSVGDMAAVVNQSIPDGFTSAIFIPGAFDLGCGRSYAPKKAFAKAYFGSSSYLFVFIFPVFSHSSISRTFSVRSVGCCTLSKILP